MERSGGRIPSPVSADAEQPVECLCGVAAAVHHSHALQADHAVPVAGGCGGPHHIQAMPGKGHGVQHKDIIHEAAGGFGVAPPEDQHEVGAPHHGCMVGPSSGDVSCALGTGPESGAEGQHMHVCETLGGAVHAAEHDEGVRGVPHRRVSMPGARGGLQRSPFGCTDN